MTDLTKARWLVLELAAPGRLGKTNYMHREAANTIRDLCDEVEQLREGIHFGEPHELPEKQELGLEPCSLVVEHTPSFPEAVAEFMRNDIEEAVEGPGIDIECKDGGTIHVVGAEWKDDKKEVIVIPVKEGVRPDSFDAMTEALWHLHEHSLDKEHKTPQSVFDKLNDILGE